MIYLINVPSIGLCKVGYAADVYARLDVGKAFIPGKFSLSSVREGGRRLEKAIHRAARAHQVHSEWFRNHDAVLAIFGAIEAPPEPEVKRNGFARFLAENKITAEDMATRIGASVSAVRKWARDERIPGKDQMRRIAEVTDGAVMPIDFYEWARLPVVPAGQTEAAQ